MQRYSICIEFDLSINQQEILLMVEKMQQLATHYHAGQERRGNEHTPYIVHPQEVVKMLSSWGVPENSPVLAAAWGHDLLEDTAATPREIAENSSDMVLDWIKMLTCSPEENKSVYLQKLSSCGVLEILLIKAADRICNTGDFLRTEGALRAYRYLHSADMIFEALKKFEADLPAENALLEYDKLNERLESPAQRDAIRGSLLAGAAGDALGSPVEFLNQSQIYKLYGSNGVTEYSEFGKQGSITDDTQMTLFTIEGILRGVVRDYEKGICEPESIMYNAYLRWRKTQGSCVMEIEDSGWMIKEKALWEVRAPGNTCLSSLEKPFRGGKVNNSKGCGSVMRMAPVGLCMAPEEAYKWGCKFGAITHGHDTGVTAAGAFAMLISYLVKEGCGLEESVRKVLAHLAADPRAGETLSALQKVFTAQDITELGEGWIAEEALAISVYAVLLYPYDLRKAVQLAVNISGDSDSTGAITGNIAGAINGESAIPPSWLNNLREYTIVSQAADDLHSWFESDEYGHCTPEWWNKYPGY